jgi:hypothetical protein
MRRFFVAVILMSVVALGCNTNKPADEVLDAKDRAKQKVEDAREDQREAAEETGEE